jgi:hypothetical protein
MGTALLAFTYLFITFAEIANTLGLWFDAYKAVPRAAIGGIQIMFVSFYLTSLVFLYFFANRHILRDNDWLKAIVGVFGGQLVAVGTTLMFMDLIQGEPYTFVSNLFMGQVNIYRFVPSTTLALIMLLPLLLLVVIRIIIRLLGLRTQIKDRVARKGITYILWSFVCITLTFIAASAFTIDLIQTSPLAMSFFHGLRMALSITALLLGYLGWILPNWLKRRIRGKAWIAQTAEKLERQKITYPHSVSKNLKKFEEIQVEEIAEQ